MGRQALIPATSRPPRDGSFPAPVISTPQPAAACSVSAFGPPPQAKSGQASIR
ncbi:hypothetical protein CCC_00238 [Paramagnetospirillum magnetotacticum MS-1]|uniref:Uncharacterized protein n=1 Tax=Paramagnetospirillum magnetotacticum MS-1 TaxID=272627 RepID=A0A0C2U6U2_PARME|nr:hypothetical protein CCC_00238 [Paramagnetospirillum magnetotacticum MS-1]